MNAMPTMNTATMQVIREATAFETLVARGVLKNARRRGMTDDELLQGLDDHFGEAAYVCAEICDTFGLIVEFEQVVLEVRRLAVQ